MNLRMWNHDIAVEFTLGESKFIYQMDHFLAACYFLWC